MKGEMELPVSFKEMMENDSDGEESEKISEAFICCVCRDLLYKPVVLACGHISCFWCINKSMSGLHKSRCPICRNRYYHFPSICQTLLSLLLKMYPLAYKKREKQILEDEKATGYFSPQLNDPAHQSQPGETVIQTTDANQPRNSGANPSLVSCSIKTEDIVTTSTCTVKYENSNEINFNGTCRQVLINDVLCGSCLQVLFRPIVLNCGHVFCNSCIILQTNETLKCETCQSPHPGDVPKVCLEFNHFVEEQFPKEYGLRRGVQVKQEQLPCEISRTCSSDAAKESSNLSGDGPLPWWNTSSKVHIGVGCDTCGMYPIIGDRYQCKDCTEKIGYDLCKDCYSTRSKLPGRFNQQHTADHKFEFVKSNAMHNIMLRLLRGQLQEISAATNALRDGLDDLENEIRSLVTNDDAENDSNAPETGANQGDGQE